MEQEAQVLLHRVDGIRGIPHGHEMVLGTLVRHARSHAAGVPLCQDGLHRYAARTVNACDRALFSADPMTLSRGLYDLVLTEAVARSLDAIAPDVPDLRDFDSAQ